MKKRVVDISIDNASGDQTEDMIKSIYNSNTSEDHIKMKNNLVSQSIELEHRGVF